MKKRLIHCKTFCLECLKFNNLSSSFCGMVRSMFKASNFRILYPQICKNNGFCIKVSHRADFLYPLLFSFFVLLLGACSGKGANTKKPLCTVEEKKSIIQSLSKKVERNTNQKLEEVMKNKVLSHGQKQAQMLQIITKIEPQIHSLVDISRVNSKTCRVSYEEKNIMDLIADLKQKARAKVTKWWGLQMEKSQEALSQNMGEFIQMALESNEFVGRFNKNVEGNASSVSETLAIPDLTTPQESKTDFKTAVRKVMETKYARHELGIIYETPLVPNTEVSVPYQFKSTEGEFLDQSRKLYLKTHNSKPYHEQGRIGRTLSLIAVETADEEFSKGRKETASLAYKVGEAASDIALGVTPYVGGGGRFGKDVYEALTGRHLLTGRELSNFERSMSVFGVAISGATGGIISSGSLKASLNTTGKVLSKIHKKALEQGVSFAQRGFEAVMDNSQKVLDLLQKAGFQTKKGMKSAGHFLKRAFANETPSVEEVAQTIQFVGRAGIEGYTKALKELSSSDVEFPIAGEEFLARHIRDSQKGKGAPFSQEELVKAGKLYLVGPEKL